MSDIQTVLWALPRILDACRSRRLPGADEDIDVSAHQVRLLGFLDGGDPTMVGELAEHMGVTASTMSLNLKRLREAGLVSSERDPSDRRVMNVRLTEEGVRVRDTLGSLDPVRVDGVLRGLGPAGRARAVAGLRLLAEAADAALTGAIDRPVGMLGDEAARGPVGP